MRFIKCLCFVFAPLFLFFNTSAFAYIEKETAVLRVMNKAAGKTQTVSGKVGDSIQYDGLNIKIRNPVIIILYYLYYLGLSISSVSQRDILKSEKR